MPIAALDGLHGRVSVPVTGANHGIGAGPDLCVLAAYGVRVCISFLRVEDAPDAGVPDAYRAACRQDVARSLISSLAPGPRRCGRSRPRRCRVIPALFDRAEAALGPVDILVNNAPGWIPDTFRPKPVDRLGRASRRVRLRHRSAVRRRCPGGALLIAEFARRLIERRARCGVDREPHIGGSARLPR